MLGCSNPTYSFSTGCVEVFFVLSLFLICFSFSALEEQLLLRSLEVAVSVGDAVNPQGAGRCQPDALEHQKDNCQDTTGYILPRCNWMQILLNNLTLCRLSHDEKVFRHVAGKLSRLSFCPQNLTARWLAVLNRNCSHVKLV